MAIDESLVLELVSRSESEKLDFKTHAYDSSTESKFEFAKDLMSIANGLVIDGPAGYILIGVDENSSDGTGILVGINPQTHPDDADVHEKVKHILNRVPYFSYSPIEIQGKSIGVFEIRPGGRPYYPLKSQAEKGQRLIRYQASIRRGSTTDFASPEEIQQWALEDQPLKVLSCFVEEELLAFLMAVAIKNGEESFYYPEYLQQYQRDYQEDINQMDLFGFKTVLIPNNQFQNLAFYAHTRVSLLRFLAFDALARMSLDPTYARLRNNVQLAARRTLRAVRAVTSPEFVKEREAQNMRIFEILENTKRRDKELQTVHLCSILHHGNHLMRAVHEAMNLFGHLRLGLPLIDEPAAHIPKILFNRKIEDPLNEELSEAEIIRLVQKRLAGPSETE